ncbi:hypothetical protein JL721_3324 [Aureococcus anophagefferens]|nr:hypothetical protein JL721_3324 [Aureococcus anophagefferens]
MEQLDASTLARWAAEPALYETPGKLETANDDWQRGVLRLSASGVVFCDDGRAARGMALDSVVRVTVGERKRFLKKARLTVELQGAAGTCAFDARDAFRRDAFAAPAKRAPRRCGADRGGFTTQTAGIAGLARSGARSATRPAPWRRRRATTSRHGGGAAAVAMLRSTRRADRAGRRRRPRRRAAARRHARRRRRRRGRRHGRREVAGGRGRGVRRAAPRRRRREERDAHGPLVPLQPRAGASGLVSPEDFADACGRYLDRRSPASRDAPATLRVFRSGVKVVALADDDTRPASSPTPRAARRPWGSRSRSRSARAAGAAP